MLLRFVRNRTSTIIVMYSLYLYFLGLSLQNTSKALELLHNQKKVRLLFGNGFNYLVHCRSIINIEEFLHVTAHLIYKIIITNFTQNETTYPKNKINVLKCSDSRRFIANTYAF